MIRGIIFDCFGVLYVDVSHAYFAQFPELREELYDLNSQADHGFIDRETYLTAVAKITGIKREETARAFAREHTINQPLIELIQTLKPRYKIALLTNIGRGWIQDFFDQYQLSDLFDVAVMSSEEAITKPNPLIFERTCEKLGIPPDECLVIDDSVYNCEGARAAGMHAILYKSKTQVIGELNQLLGRESA